MISVSFDKDKVHATARSIKNQLDKRKVSRENGNPVSFNQCLQIVSQGIFSKPYEELLETQLKNEPSPALDDSGVCQVVVLQYGPELIITCKGEYHTASCVGSDMETSQDSIYQQAKSLARTLNTEVKRYALPECLVVDDGYEYEKIIELAKMMGVFKYPTTIFEMFEMGIAKIFLDGHHVGTGLNGDWESSMRDIAENNASCNDDEKEDPLSQTIWMPETSDGEHFYEWFFDFSSLCRAIPFSDSNSTKWAITESGATDISYVVELYQ